MGTIIKVIANAVGVSTLTLYLIAGTAGITGLLIKWQFVKTSIRAERDVYWERRLQAETNRINDLIREERQASAQRTAEYEKHLNDLQMEINKDEPIIITLPGPSTGGIDADSVRRVDNVR